MTSRPASSLTKRQTASDPAHRLAVSAVHSAPISLDEGSFASRGPHLSAHVLRGREDGHLHRGVHLALTLGGRAAREAALLQARVRAELEERLAEHRGPPPLPGKRCCGRRLPRRRLHLVGKPRTRDVLLRVGDGGAEDVGERVLRQEGAVGRDEDVREGAQQGELLVPLQQALAVLHLVEVPEEEARLVLVDVRAVGLDLAACEASDDCLRLHKLTTGDVHQRDAGLHLLDILVVDHVLRTGQQGHMQAHDIRQTVELVQLHVLAAELLGHVLVRDDVVADDLHSETLEDLRHDLADPAGAHDAAGLAVELHAHEAAELVVAVAHAVPRDVQPPVERRDDGHRVLRHGVGAVGRHAHDPDAHLRGRVQVHAVEARAPQQHQLDAPLPEDLQNLPAAVVVHEEAYSVGTAAKVRGTLGTLLLDEERAGKLVDQRLHEGAHVRHGGVDGDLQRALH